MKAVAATLVAALAAAASASAATSDVSANWAGYVASGAVAPYTAVSGTWVQPAADCASGKTSAAFWVGLGGNSDASQSLEQTGTEADCNADGTAAYSAWYELVPAGSVTVKLKVVPGDRMFGAVRVNGTQVTVQLKDLTRRTSFVKTLTMATPDLSSAEWIAEAPSICGSYNRCRQSPLTNFGSVKFSSASATTADGHTGTISDPSWSAEAITLDTTQSDPYARFGVDAGAVQATPSALSPTGGAFSIAWSTAAPQPTAPPPGFGDGF